MWFHRVGLVGEIVNYILKGTRIMTVVEDIQAKVAEANSKLSTIAGLVDTMDTRLDDIRAKIEALMQNGGATAAELQSILDGVTGLSDTSAAIQTHAEAVVAEADDVNNE